MTCTVVDCDRPAKTRGLCGAHAMRVSRSGSVDAARPVGVYGQGRRPCSSDGCDRPAFTRGMCARHYMAAWRAERVRVGAGGAPDEPSDAQDPMPNKFTRRHFAQEIPDGSAHA